MEASKGYFWENEVVLKFLELIKKLIFVVGIPISIYTYINDTLKEREEHEYIVYNNMAEAYRHYETLAAQHPGLGLSDAVVGNDTLMNLIKPYSLLTNEEKILTVQFMNMLISLHERAYFLYAQSDSQQRANQFRGWKLDLQSWLQDNRFKDAWNNSRGYYDEEFEKYVNTLIQGKK